MECHYLQDQIVGYGHKPTQRSINVCLPMTGNDLYHTKEESHSSAKSYTPT